MCAQDPADGKWKYFVDKSLPFGASISCSHYQHFSNSLRHLVEYRTNHRSLTNYLDDFLFAAISKIICDWLIRSFLDLCEQINLPVAVEKTEWRTMVIVFLGILLDRRRLILSIPIEKQQKALNLLKGVTESKKITVKDLQVLTGYLNFLSRAIFPGRTFTRRIYAKFASYTDKKGNRKPLKPYHHIRVDTELRFDCKVWKIFLQQYTSTALCRPMVDLSLKETNSIKVLNFYSDVSAAEKLGFGAVFNNEWLCAQWEPNYMKNKPSIEYLELLALTAALLTWGHELMNQRVKIHCDNMAVVNMVNTATSSCKNCMYLIRLIVLNNLINNRRVFVLHVRSKDNILSDALSRRQFQ